MHRKTQTPRIVMFRAVMFRAVVMSVILVSVAAAQQPPADDTETDKAAAERADAPPDESPVADDKKPQPLVVDREEPQTPAQPTPEDIIRAFQQDRPVAAPIRPSGSGAAARSVERAASLVREGEFINDLSGRLAHDGNWWTIVFESDSPDAPRPPMRLLPNQLLERMVRETEAASTSVTYIVSGEVTLFESKNYLLLRKVLRTRNVSALGK